jgi:VIT1/CCC1 family predicted Fe2+/Mn2+ transporter
MKRNVSAVSYFRNFVFGVEDSLVSTVGLLSGIAIADVPRHTIFLTGIVLIFVEAFSMAAGSFLSESSVEEFDRPRRRPRERSLVSGAIMFVSYFVSGFIPLCPYLFLPVESGFILSIALSVSALFVLGLVSGWISRVNAFVTGARMFMIGGVAIAVGVAVGRLFHAM